MSAAGPIPHPASQNPAMKKAALLQAVTMLDGLVEAFGNDAPENVRVKAKEFRDALKGWAENGS